MTSDGHTASYYSTVEQVASSKVTFFLTRYDVPAYTKTEESEWDKLSGDDVTTSAFQL